MEKVKIQFCPQEKFENFKNEHVKKVKHENTVNLV